MDLPRLRAHHDALRYNNRFALVHDLAESSWTWRPNQASASLPMRRYGAFHPGTGLGGAMVHWTAVTWRFPVPDFIDRTHYTERYGADKLPEEMTVQDWGVTYDDLEPWYDRLEYDIGVSGQAGNLGGTIIPGGNPFEGPRARPYPLPPLAPMPFGQRFAKGADDLGYHSFPTPAGILSEGYTDRFGNTRAGR